jgi:transcriptional regulator with XRE-family HTH domain
VRKLAKMVGIHVTYLSKIERGEMPPPAWDKILALGYHLKSEPLLQAAFDALHQTFHERTVIFLEGLDDASVWMNQEPNNFKGRNDAEKKVKKMKDLFQKIMKLSEAERIRITKE